MESPFGTFWKLVIRAFLGTYRDGCFGTAKGVAYSSLLAFFPLLATVAAVLVRTNAQYVEELLSTFLASVLPPDTEDLVMAHFARKQSVFLPVTATLLSIWAASGATTSLMQGFRAAYRIANGRSFVKDRLVGIGLVFSAAIPLIGASSLVFFGHRVELWMVGWLGLIKTSTDLKGWLSVFSTMVRYVIALGAISVGTAIMYYYGPNRRQRWNRVIPGALVATLLWFAATGLFAWYARNMANYSLVYGSIAAVIALLVWMYLLAVIAFVGCEFNREYELWVKSYVPAQAAKKETSTHGATRTEAEAPS